MLFYPDQFFYANAPHGGSRRSRHHGGRHSARHESQDDDEAPAWFGQSRGPSPWSRGSSPWSRAPRQQVPDEYIVLDEDELNALRAFREAKRRTSQREQYEQAQAARRKAEAERKAREAARREAEARMRAQVEANARAAAREYLRRQQARQQAILEAQQAERQRQQQYVMEQLRQQFGLFAVPTPARFEGVEQGDDYDEHQQQQQQQQQHQHQQEESAEAAARSQLDAACAQASEEASASKAASEQPQDQREPYDPIRSLIEALAPYPFVIATESSDEEEQEQRQNDKEDESEAEDETVPVEFVLEPDTALEGPTCETASDDSEPVYVEEPDFRVHSAEPPIPVEYDSGEDAPSLKDRRKERQASAPVDHLKKAKTKEYRRAAKKDAKKERKEQRQQARQQAKPAKSEAPKQQPSGAEISGLLTALADELKRLQDAYGRLSTAKPTGDLREVISRLEAVKIGYSRSEEIYNKLDEVRATKDERKLKHEITTESVALADKYEELLNAVYAEKKDVSAKNSRSPSPAGGAPATAGAAAASTDSSPKHEVVLEEVQDESD